MDEIQVLAEIKQEYKYGFRDPEKYVFKARKGLDHEIIDIISDMKGEPDWMRQFRHRALDLFLAKPLPTWGGDLSGIDFDDIYYYIKPAEKQGKSWDDVPADIKNTFDRLGIPEAERKFLAGVGAQYESEVVYHSLKEEWEKMGVIFLDTDTALREHPDLFREYFGTVIPPADNKFAALNSAVWSGGSFIYVPKGVKLDIPLQAYFRINAQNMGQFERTLIIVDEGASAHYVEGCTAPIYASDSLHSAVVEIIVKAGGRCRYTTIQNWSNNVYNLVTKRAVAYEDALMEWIDGNLGCLTGDTEVLLNSDIKPISEVAPGDVVYSLDANLQLVRSPVVAKRYSGQQQVFRLRTENHREIRATANHPFLALVKQGKSFALAWKRLDELSVDDWIAIVGDVPDHGHFGDEQYDRPVHFSRVVEITPLGMEDTWDLEIANSHNFVANGLIVHNSKLTMKYPAVYMLGKGARAEILSIAFAGRGQHQDAGGKVVHGAPYTSSRIISKSISKDGGRASYRGLLKVAEGAVGSKANVVCDALILDEASRSDTYPYIEIDEDDVTIGHEATVSKIGDEQLFYLMSRGLSEEEAATMIVSGFIEPMIKELPMEYAVEMNRLIQLQMEGSVG